MSGAPKFGDTHGVADDALCGSSSEYLFHFPTRVVVRRVLFCHPSLVELLFRFFIRPHSSPFVIRLKQLKDHWLSSEFGAANWMDNQ